MHEAGRPLPDRGGETEASATGYSAVLQLRAADVHPGRLRVCLEGAGIEHPPLDRRPQVVCITRVRCVPLVPGDATRTVANVPHCRPEAGGAHQAVV